MEHDDWAKGPNDQRDKSWASIENKSASQKISRQEILYVEQCARKVCIHVAGGVVTKYGKVREFWEHWGTPFCLCHTYLLVNLSRIARMSKGSIVFETGDTLYLGKESYARTKKAFSRYLAEISS